MLSLFLLTVICKSKKKLIKVSKITIFYILALVPMVPEKFNVKQASSYRKTDQNLKH